MLRVPPVRLVRLVFLLHLASLALASAARAFGPEDLVRLPANLQIVLTNTQPLPAPRGGRLPLLVLPISQSLAGLDDALTEATLRELDRRGLGYSVEWTPDTEASLTEALRIAALQQRLGLETVANATGCLSSFFDGSDAMQHIDDAGRPFAETSFGGKLGCPFTLEPRVPVIAGRVTRFAQAYRAAGRPLDLVFADWEIDGPIEWNDAWASSKRCRRCRENLPHIQDFRAFQRRLREIRSDLQRRALAEPVLREFPGALVGNYAVHPHDGWRYWYDYFEHEPTDPAIPTRPDQRARYRPWAHEFPGTGFTFAMPVVYTWYPIFQWYDRIGDPDYRWFYNLLLEASSVGRHTPAHVPILPFVHWTTTAPPEKPDPAVRQFSAAKYQELLAHLLLRGHDTFFLWCMPNELAQEIRLVHEVYAEALRYRGFLERGESVSFAVPAEPGPVVSGLRLGDRVLVRRTDFGDVRPPLALTLADGRTLDVPAGPGFQILPLPPAPRTNASLRDARGRRRFPIGFYELPKSDEALRQLAAAGVNLVRCSSRADLDRAHAAGLLGWVPLNLQNGPGPELDARITNVVEHPALAVWEGPDEIVWTFTAYSGLAQSTGFTRADWQGQHPKAVASATATAAQLLPRLRDGITRVRQLDPRRRPVWINEAADSDAALVREYVDAIDVTGCDLYPVRSTGTDLPGIGRATDRWRAIGRERPVWMVLQAFSWHALKPERSRLYPTLAESRFMAFDALVHGASGILYWGSETIDDPEFRRSLDAVTTELARLEPWLLGTPLADWKLQVIDEISDASPPNVRALVLRSADQDNEAVIVVNEDARAHLGVELVGLEALDGRWLKRTDGDEKIQVRHGGFVVRLQGHQVKVLTTASSGGTSTGGTSTGGTSTGGTSSASP